DSLVGQLRFLYLQPRAVSWRAGLSGRSPSQRQNYRGRNHTSQARTHRDFSRPLHAAGGGHFRGTGRATGRKISYSRCMPRPSSHWRRVRRENRPRSETLSRQDQPDPSRRQKHFPQAAGSLHRHTLSFVDRREKIPAARIGDHGGDRRRHHHGLPSPPPQNRRRPIPSRVRSYRFRQAALAEFFVPLTLVRGSSRRFSVVSVPSVLSFLFFTNLDPPGSRHRSPSRARNGRAANS